MKDRRSKPNAMAGQDGVGLEQPLRHLGAEPDEIGKETGFAAVAEARLAGAIEAFGGCFILGGRGSANRCRVRYFCRCC